MRRAIERLRCERERRGWSRDFVAQKVGSDVHTVGRWERGNTFPSPYYRQKLCELFEKNAEELGLIKESTDGSGEPYPDESPPDQQSQASPLSKEDIQATTDNTVQEIPLPAAPIPVRQPAPVPANQGHSIPKLMITLTAIIMVLILLFASWKLFASPPTSSTGHSPATPFPTTSTGLIKTLWLSGRWIRPIDGQKVGDNIDFAAHAYTTSLNNPPVARVIFTIYIRGRWKGACTAYQLANSDVFQCSANLKSLGAIPGPLWVNFDVFDSMDRIKHSPNGSRSIIYLSNG